MPKMKSLAIKELDLDLENYRTLKQPDESHALETMITVSPNKFWGLLESLIDNGYLPTENVIVLEDGDGGYKVKEGNRRVAALKLAHKLLERDAGPIPDHINKKLSAIGASWLKDNSNVPCTIYRESEKSIVDTIVSLTHAKAQTAGRDQWTSVARARHARDENGHSEPALDLLEKYLNEGKNVSDSKRELWGGDYNLTVLDALIGKIPDSFGDQSKDGLVKAYPKIAKRAELENIMHDIGQDLFGFKNVREI